MLYLTLSYHLTQEFKKMENLLQVAFYLEECK